MATLKYAVNSVDLLQKCFNFELHHTIGEDAVKQKNREHTNETKSIIWGLYGERLA